MLKLPQFEQCAVYEVFVIDGMVLAIITLLTAKKHIVHGLCHVGGQKQPHGWNPRPRFTYSIYNFYGATMMTKGSL